MSLIIQKKLIFNTLIINLLKINHQFTMDKTQLEERLKFIKDNNLVQDIKPYSIEFFQKMKEDLLQSQTFTEDFFKHRH